MLTDNLIQKQIVSTEFSRIGKKTTVCCLTLTNGFEVIGTSSCVNPEKYNEELGQKYSRERALAKIWELEGYRAQWELFIKDCNEKVSDNSCVADC